MSRPEDSGPHPQGKIASGIHETTKLGRFIAGLSAEKIQALALVGMTLFMCALTAYIVWKWDTSNARRETSVDERLAVVMRAAESRDELLRAHCAAEVKETRVAHAAIAKELQLNASNERKDRAKVELERDKERMRFEGEERDKLNKMVGQLATELTRWREQIGPKLGRPPGPDDPISIAPMPRKKPVIGSTSFDGTTLPKNVPVDSIGPTPPIEDAPATESGNLNFVPVGFG